MFRIKNSDFPNNYWELNATKSRRDLLIKKIAVALIAVLNLAILTGALYFLISYSPIPAEAYLISPFIIGVLSALTYLKFPTYGVNPFNYTYYSNPTTILGKTMTYLFFGPYMLAVKKCDWTAYHDPFVANKIAHDLSDKTITFAKLADEYGQHFSNFAKYGIIHPDDKEAFIDLYKAYKPIDKGLKFYEKEGVPWCSNATELRNQKEELESNWEELREKITPNLYFPNMPDLDFESSLTSCHLKIRKTLFNPPFEN